MHNEFLKNFRPIPINMLIRLVVLFSLGIMSIFLISQNFYYKYSNEIWNASEIKYKIASTEPALKTIPVHNEDREKTKAEADVFLKQKWFKMLRSTLDAVPGPSFSKGFCEKNLSEATFAIGQNWQFNETLFMKWLFGENPDTMLLYREEQICQNIREKLSFFDKPFSKEEDEFPLAYGTLLYKNSSQVYLMLSAFYQPQNLYCLAIDAKSDPNFKREIELLGRCFPNVFVIQVEDVLYMDITVVYGTFKCLRYLSESKHPWKYYQYLSNFDLPLKTNLEMVRIFKKLNGTINAEVANGSRFVDYYRSGRPPLTLWKSSMSSLIPRAAVDAIVASPMALKLLNYLRPSVTPDEIFTLTLLGNPKDLNMPVSLDAEAIFKKIQADGEEKIRRLFRQKENDNNKFPIVLEPENNAEEPFEPIFYYISRYQVWSYTGGTKQCHSGQFSSASCIFGLKDVAELLCRPEMIAHKFRMDFEPAVYFCLYGAIRERAFDWEKQRLFKGSAYEQLPFVRLAAGTPLSSIYFSDFDDSYFSQRHNTR